MFLKTMSLITMLRRKISRDAHKGIIKIFPPHPGVIPLTFVAGGENN